MHRSTKRHLIMTMAAVGMLGACGRAASTVDQSAGAPAPRPTQTQLTATTLTEAQHRLVGSDPAGRERGYSSLPEHMRAGARWHDEMVMERGLVPVSGLTLEMGFVKVEEAGIPRPARREDLVNVYDEHGNVVAYWAGGEWGVLPKDVVDRGDKTIDELLAMRERVEI